MRASINFVIILATILHLGSGNICGQRKQWGIACDSCTKRVFCAFQDNVWEAIPMETCNTGYQCKDSGCIKSDFPCAEITKEAFKCRSEGIFPNPYECNKYHFCYKNDIEMQQIDATCPTGKAFSVKTRGCTLAANDEVCNGYQFSCNHVGQTAAWPENDNIYYICLNPDSQTDKIFPALFRCAIGQSFYEFQCTNSTSGPCPQPMSVPIKLECLMTGFYKHPDDCTKYYYCDSNLNAKVYNCKPGSYFHSESGKCKIGTC